MGTFLAELVRLISEDVCGLLAAIDFWMYVKKSPAFVPLNQLRLKIPLKVKIFSWILLRKRLLTADRLIRRGCLVDQHCIFCAVFSESCDHLFRDCVFVKFLLISVEGPVVGEPHSGDVRCLWNETLSIPTTVLRSKCLTRLVASWWVVWTERNNTIFREIPPNASRALERVVALTKDWLDVP